jgi:hypothetical protein
LLRNCTFELLGNIVRVVETRNFEQVTEKQGDCADREKYWHTEPEDHRHEDGIEHSDVLQMHHELRTFVNPNVLHDCLGFCFVLAFFAALASSIKLPFDEAKQPKQHEQNDWEVHVEYHRTHNCVACRTEPAHVEVWKLPSCEVVLSINQFSVVVRSDKHRHNGGVEQHSKEDPPRRSRIFFRLSPITDSADQCKTDFSDGQVEQDD